MLCLPYDIIAFIVQRRIIMQIKVIYEDDALLPVKECLEQLDNHQLFFVEQYIRTRKAAQHEAIFQQWLCAMQQILHTYT
jgi:hypothetical protein